MTKSIIVARSANHVIGKDGKLPWHIPADMKHFREITNGHHLIMGRKTFESLPGLLPNRKIIVLSHNTNYQAENCVVVGNLQQAFKVAEEANEQEVFIAGGAEVYKEALPVVNKIYLTVVYAKIEGDTFFPVLENHEWIEINKSYQTTTPICDYSYDFIELDRRV